MMKLSSALEGLYKFLHRNIPQLLLYMVRAKINICIWGRATGKTAGVTAVLSLYNVLTMPRSVGAIGSASYANMIGEILPELVMAWEKMGYIEGVHFWVQKFPPADLKVPRPLRPPQTADHVIFWCNGSAIKLFSINFQSLKNGDSLDWMIVEEARKAKFEKLKDIFKCLRGNVDVFGHVPQHLGLTVVTDMPQDRNSDWLFEFRDLMVDEDIQYILELEQQVSLRYWELQQTQSAKRRAQLERQIEQFRAEADQKRSEAVYVSYASTLDNIHALGEDTIRQYIRTTTSELDARLSLLNERLMQVDACFYAHLSEDRHGREGTNFRYIQELRKYELPNWRWQSDLDVYQPLDIALDYNAKFSSLIVGQMWEDENRYHFAKNLYVEHPERLSKLVHNFCDYFGGYPFTEVNYYFDQTAIGEDAEKRREAGETFDQIVIRVLRERGWTVNEYYLGNAWSHKKRYEEIGNIFQEVDNAPFTFSYNIEQCAEWKEACGNAGVILRSTYKGTRVEKNKATETDGKTPPVLATHLTEVGDTLFMGRIYSPPSTVSSIAGAVLE